MLWVPAARACRLPPSSTSASSTRTSETFDPNGQVVRSTQTRDTANISNTTGDQQGVSVSGQLPGGGGNGNSTPSGEQAKTTEETINYEISKTTETAGRSGRRDQAPVYRRGRRWRLQPGRQWQPDLCSPFRPMSSTQLTTLVKSAVGL